MTAPDSPSTDEVAAHYAQRAQNPRTLLKGVWRGEYPPGSPRPDALTLSVKLVAVPTLLLRCISVSTLVRRKGPNAIDLVVLVWAAITSALLVAMGTETVRSSAAVKWIILGIAGYRLADTLSQKLLEILLHSFKAPLLAGVQRSVVLGAVNLYEIAASYAILFLGSGHILSTIGPLNDAITAFYFSTVTALTVGYGDFVPTTDGSRLLVISEIAVVAVYVFAWFPRVVSLLFPERADNR